MLRRLGRAPLVSICDDVHLLEDQGQRQERCVPLNACTAHYRGAEGDSAAVLDVSSLHLQPHIFKGMKLQEPVDYTVVAEADCVPVEALHRSGNDRSVSDLTAHPP